jgi:integrase/recombinase XerD
MLKLWIEFFEDLEHVRGRSKNTVSAYRRDLSLYEEFRETKKSVPQFYTFMKDKGLSERSQARVISSVRTYLKFLEKNDVPIPELRELKLPRVNKKPPETIGFEDFEKLLEASAAAKKPSQVVRNQLLLYMMFGLGLRVSEVTGLNLESVKLDESSIVILGKGGKERVLPLNSQLKDFLMDYLDNHRKDLCFDEKERSLFINNKSRRPSRVDIWRWMEAWSKKAGFEKTVHPHQFRHACATSLLENGANLRSIQILLGHTSLQTTQMYTTVTRSHLNKVLDDSHPFSEVDLVKKIQDPNI